MDLKTPETLRTMEEQRRDYVQRALHRFVNGRIPDGISLPPTAHDSAQDPTFDGVHKPPHHSSGLASSHTARPGFRWCRATSHRNALDRCAVGLPRSDKTLPEMSMDEKMNLFDGYRVVRSWKDGWTRNVFADGARCIRVHACSSRLCGKPTTPSSEPLVTDG